MLLQSPDKVIADFELSLAYDSLLQLELYSFGINKIPLFYKDSNESLGTIERPGIVHIDATKYKDLINEINKDFLSNINYIYKIVSTGNLLLKRLRQQIHAFLSKEIEEYKVKELKQMFDTLTTVMAMTSFNWTVPLEEYKQAFIKHFGSQNGNRIFLNLNIPTVIPHFTQVELGLLKMAVNKLRGKYYDTNYFIEHIGCLLNFGIGDSKLEDKNGVEEEIKHIIERYEGSIKKIEQRIAKIKKQKEYALLKKKNSYYEIINQGNDLLVFYALLIEFVNEEEEMRHILQMKAQRIFKKVAKKFNLELRNLTFDVLFRTMEGAVNGTNNYSIKS